MIERFFDFFLREIRNYNFIRNILICKYWYLINFLKNCIGMKEVIYILELVVGC